MIERLLSLPLLNPASPQWGMRNALSKISGEVLELDWFPHWRTRTLPQFRLELIERVKTFQPTVTWMQLQTDGVMNAQVLNAIPGIKVVWGGDLRDQLPQWASDIAPHVDVVLMSNHRDVDALRAKGFASADYLQIGVGDNFSPTGDTRDGTPEIIFCGNNYPNRFERSNYRAKMVIALQLRYGKRFATFGSGWGPKDVWLDETAEAAAYRTCKIAISAEHYHVPGFCSDRVYRATGSGAFLLHDQFPGYADHFIDGQEAVSWKDFDDLFQKIDYYLNNGDERKMIAAHGENRTRTTHSWDARMVDLQRIIEKCQVMA